MKKKISVILSILLLSAVAVYSDETKHASIQSVMSNILQEQGLTNGQKIDADKVSRNLLEELGDAVMDAMIPDPAVHERMDQMMGGEGSASLADMHRRMGYNYLTGYSPGMMMGMFGYPLSGTNRTIGGPMMGNYRYGYGMMGWSPWGAVTIGLLVLIVIGFAVFFVVKMARNGSLPAEAPSENAIEILKKRYARGEISKEEFESIKRDL